jgi:hypothetical protein
MAQSLFSSKKTKQPKKSNDNTSDEQVVLSEPTAVPLPPKTGKLPGGWEESVDPTTKVVFYLNMKTGDFTEERPTTCVPGYELEEADMLPELGGLSVGEESESGRRRNRIRGKFVVEKQRGRSSTEPAMILSLPEELITVDGNVYNVAGLFLFLLLFFRCRSAFFFFSSPPPTPFFRF